MVFVDFYTTWCGPCKQMSEQTFTQKEAGDYFNHAFINVKIDAEKGEGRTLAVRYGITAYPTCVFVAPSGKLVYKFMGFRETDALLAEGAKAMEIHELLPRLERFEESYAAGKRETAFLADYYALLKKTGAGGGAVLNDYLLALPDSLLFSTEIAAEYANFSEVNPALYSRIATHIVSLDPVADKKLRGSLSSSLMKGISNLLRPVSAAGNEEALELLLGIKQQIGATDSHIAAMMGGGAAFMPSDQLRLGFYRSNKHNSRYLDKMEAYLEAQLQEMPLDTLIRQQQESERAMKEALDKALAQNDTLEVKRLKKTESMLNLFVELERKMRSAFFLEEAGYYWELSPQTAPYRMRVREWCAYAYQLARGLSSAWSAADLMETLGEKELTRSYLQRGLEDAPRYDTDATEEDINKVRERLEGID